MTLGINIIDGYQEYSLHIPPKNGILYGSGAKPETKGVRLKEIKKTPINTHVFDGMID